EISNRTVFIGTYGRLNRAADAGDSLSGSLGNALVQRDLVRYVRPRQEVLLWRGLAEERTHPGGHEGELVHGFYAKNLLDGAGHVDLRVEGAVDGYTSPGAVGVHLLLDVWADEVAGTAMTVDVVDAVLCVVFLDQDQGRGPNGAVGNDI